MNMDILQKIYKPLSLNFNDGEVYLKILMMKL